MRCAHEAKAVLPDNVLVLMSDAHHVDWIMHPLAVAVTRGATKALKEILAAGANTERLDSDGETALFVAAAAGREKETKMLLDAGADVNALSNITGFTPLFRASSGQDCMGTGVIKILLDSGAQLNATCCPGSANTGLTALHYAAIGGCESSIRALVKAGLDPSVPTDLNRTPLHMAGAAKHADAVGVLLALGADPNRVDYLGNTPLMDATHRRCEACVSRLLPVSNLSITNRDGHNAFTKCLAVKTTPPLPIDDPCATVFAKYSEKALCENAAG